MTEIWRPCAESPAYEISDFGRVRRNGRLLALHANRAGHLYWKASAANVKRKIYVHRAVLLTFEGKHPTLPNVLHKDGNPAHNAVTNLYWGDQRSNMADARRHGTLAVEERHGMAKLTNEQRAAIRADHRSQRAVAADYGVCHATIGRIR